MENYRNWLVEEKTSFLKLVRDVLCSKNGAEAGKMQFEQDLLRISEAFDMAALCHEGEMRDNKKDPYITHPIAVAEILLKEFSTTNVNQIIVALLHDTIEKDKRFKKLISERFGLLIAQHVDRLSKKELHVYLQPRERPLYHAREILSHISRRYLSIIMPGSQKGNMPFVGHDLLKATLKNMRNHDYFSGLDQLDDDEFPVKLADRIHALRTIDACDSEKQGRIVSATYEYFVPVSETRCPSGHDLLARELIRIAQKNTQERVYRAYPCLVNS